MLGVADDRLEVSCKFSVRVESMCICVMLVVVGCGVHGVVASPGPIIRFSL